MIKNKKSIQHRTLAFEASGLRVREGADGEGRTISGYAILFNTPSAVLGVDAKGREVTEVIDASAVPLSLLEASDIKFTMYHDRQLILARSNHGKGTLTYAVDDRGVSFEFAAPATANGEEALELVRRGDIAGCSFAFSTYYDDPEYVAVETSETALQYTVKRMLGIYDMTLTADPAYPDTSVSARELGDMLPMEGPEILEMKAYTAPMRDAASMKLKF